MRRYITLMLCMLLMFGAVAFPQLKGADSCMHLMPGYNPANTGLASDDCQPSSLEDLGVKWKIDARASEYYYRPVVIDDKVYTIKPDSIIMIDISSGEIEKKKEDGAMWSSEISPVSDGKYLYFYHSGYDGMLDEADNGLSCVDLKDFSLAWDAPIDNFDAASLCIGEGKIVLTDLKRRIVCCSAKDGKTEWRFDTEGRVLSSVAINDGKVFVGDEEGILYCVELKSGKELWTFQTGKEIKATPTVSNGKLYFGATDSNFYCLDPKTGKKIWVYQDNKKPIEKSAATNGKLIVFPCSPGPVICLDAATGAKKWQFLTYGDTFHGFPTICKDKVYFASDTKMFVLDITTGKKLVEFDGSNAGNLGSIVIPTKNGILVKSGPEFKLVASKKGGSVDDFITKIEIAPPINKMYIGQSVKLRARGYDGNRKFAKIVEPRWSIDNNKIAEITPDGTLKALSEGSAFVSADYKTANDKMYITVNAKKPRKQAASYLEITPDPEENSFEFAFGDKFQFNAKVLDEYREPVEWAKITWKVNYPDTCTIDDTGLLHVNPGTNLEVGSLTCSSENLQVGIQFKIKKRDPAEDVIVKVVVKPENPTIKFGERVEFTAACFNKFGKEILPQYVDWEMIKSDDLGTINRSNGSFVAFSKAGKAIVSAKAIPSHITGQTTVTIVAPEKPPTEQVDVAQLKVFPTSFPSMMVDEFKDIFAKALDSSGKDMTEVPIKMSTDNDKIAFAMDTLNNGRNGVVIGKSPGKCNVVVTAGNKTVKIPVTVVAKPPTTKIVVNMTKVVIEKGEVFEILATGYDKNGKVIPSTFKWTTSTIKISKSDEHQKGCKFAGLEVLKGTITVKADKVSVTIAVEIVQNVPAVKIAVKPTSLKLQVGKTAELVFTAYDKNNKPIIGKSFFLEIPYDALKQENLVSKAKITALNKPGKYTITVKCGNLSLKVPIEIVK